MISGTAVRKEMNERLAAVAKKRQHLAETDKTNPQEKFGTEHANNCKQVRSLVQHPGWEIIQNKLIDAANPYSAFDDEGNLIPKAAHISEFAFKLLLEINNMVNFISKTKRESA